MKKHYSNQINRWVAAAALIGAQFYGAASHGAPLSDADVQALIQKVNDLEQQVKALQRDREVDQETAADTAKTTPTVSIGANGLIVRSADTNFVMDIHGYAQVDDRSYLGEKSVPDTLLLRRIRPIFEGTVWQDYNYRLMLDLGAGNVTSSTANNVAILDDAYVNAHFWQEAQIQVGKFKSPVGLERLQSTADLFFVETGYATELTPNYDLGVMVHNDVFNEPIGYALGIFDGSTDNANEDADVDEGKDVEGRLFLQPFLNKNIAPLKGLGFGVGGSVGTHTAAVGGTLPSYKTPGQQALFAYQNVTPTGELYRIDPQAYYFWGPFGVMGEYILSSQQYNVTKPPTGVPPVERFNNRAWQVEGTYFLTGEENSFKASAYKHVVPWHRFSLHDGGWGAWEVVARVQQLSLDKDAFIDNGFLAKGIQQATSWGVGINWYLNSNVKLNLNYDSTTFSGGNAGELATAKPEHVILSQVQFQF
jgi:phosphate-selective porin OprO and OprP